MHRIFVIVFISLSILFSQTSLNRELDDIKKQLENQLNQSEQERLVLDIEPPSMEPVTLTNPDIDTEPNTYYGYEYFEKDISFFDNIPTPADYKLGPGDEIIISLWGENNSRENLTINKDGMIYYKNIGFINLSNKTLASAELVLKEELSRIYSTLKDQVNPTMLMLELGKLKSINIFFSGHIKNPGINLIHPFSDIFSAIIQAGGLNDNASLRKVQLIRNDQIINTVDFYSFFMSGENTFSNIKLIDGDIIHIPSFKNRITISGEVNRPSTYELLFNESISDIISYASGFTSVASSTLILNQIIPIEKRLSDDNARTSTAISFKNSESMILNNGDNIKVLPISDVDVNVEIFGRVKSQGVYPASSNNSLKYILDIAGGFEDPVFRQTILEDEILVLRQDSDQFYSKEIPVTYNDSDQFKLKQNDKIFVYEKINYENSFTYRVEGEVFKPGTYPLNSSNLTVGEALSRAGGLTTLSSERNLIVKQEFTNVDDDGNEITTSETVNNITIDFKIGINSVIIASPFENVVRVEGNVYNPGLITYMKGSKLPRYIELAGGYKPNSIKRNVHIKRANGNIEQSNIVTLGFGKNIYPGDTIIVPVDPNPSDFDITTFIADLSTTLANIAAILLIVDNQN